MNKPTLINGCLTFVLCVLLFTGCAPLRPQTDPEMDKAALGLSHQAASLNQQITSSRGNGWATLQTQTETIKYKIAWAAVYPNKIRITFLMFGQPIETIVSTGQRVTFLSHTSRHARYSFETQDPDMENYIHVPIKMSEIIAILLGRLPIKPYDDAYFSSSDTGMGLVTLHQKQSGPVQVLAFDTFQTLYQMTCISSSREPLYDYRILAYEPHDFGQLPTTIEITDQKNRKLSLSITHFVANPQVKDSVFVLTEQG